MTTSAPPVESGGRLLGKAAQTRARDTPIPSDVPLAPRDVVTRTHRYAPPVTSTPATTGPRVPYRETSEAQAIGIAVATRHGARQVMTSLVGADFYNARFARLFAVLPQLEEVEGWDAGKQRAAELLDLPTDLIGEILDSLVQMADSRGRWARRVRHNARRRQAMQLAADVFNNSADASVDDLLTLARRIVAILEELAAEPIALAVVS